MAADASWLVQQAVKSAIETAISPYPVYDEVPPAAALPYVQIGDDTILDDGTKDKAGQEITITVHAFSRARGKSEAKQLLADVYAALHQQTLTIAGFGVSMIRFEFGDSFTEQEDERHTIRHAVHRYRIKLKEN